MQISMATTAPKKSPKAPAKRATQVKPNASQEICFVIMPFGGWLDDYYTSIYRVAIEEAGLIPHRADDLFRPSTIVNDIWAYTKKAKVLLADLTGKNPNVFYELGLAHALGKPVILVAESMEDIPFDLRALRIILYDKNAPDWGHRLCGKIHNALAEVLLAPIEAVLPAFIEVKNAPKPTVSAEQKDLIEIKQEMDLLRRELRMREAVVHENKVENSYVSKSAFAKEMIRQSVKEGLSDTMIATRVANSSGAPDSWIRQQLARYRFEYQDIRPLSRSKRAFDLDVESPVELKNSAPVAKARLETTVNNIHQSKASIASKEKQDLVSEKTVSIKRPAKVRTGEVVKRVTRKI
jgi:hypothetical protein